MFDPDKPAPTLHQVLRIEAMGAQPVPEVSDELANKPVAAPAS